MSFAECERPAPDHEVVPEPRPIMPRDDRRDLVHLASTVGNAAFTRALARSPDVRLLQRQGPAGSTVALPAAGALPAATGHYQVGGVSYTEDQYNVAVGQVAGLWVAGNGIVAKQKQAVQRFCGKGGAGADADPDLLEGLFEAAVLAIIAVATDGVGLTVGAAAERGIGKLISALPKAIAREPVEKAAKVVIDKAVDKGKEKAKEVAKGSVSKAPKVSVGGGRKLATPLASYQAVLEDSIDSGCGAEKDKTLQTLLDLQAVSPPELKWIAAAAIYDGLTATLAEIDELEWNAVSDGWFRMQTASGRATTKGVDIGRMSIDLKKDTYPDGGPPAIKAAYLYAEGVNETTLEPYSHRALKDIGLSKQVVMDNGSMGWGWVECGWKMLLGADNEFIDVKGTNRYGELWLAAKAVGKHDLDTDDDEFRYQNVVKGAQMVWDEIQNRTTKFEEAGATSGPGPW